MSGGVNELRAQLKGELFGVLGNHDSIYMAPSLEAMGKFISSCRRTIADESRSFPLFPAVPTLLREIE